MIIDLNTDIKIVALTSAALRLENVANEKHVTDPTLIADVKDMARRIRREISILQLNAQT